MHHSRLIAKARNGDREATAELLDGYRNYLHLLAQMQFDKTLKSKIDASDVVQEACLAACRDFQMFRGQSEHELLGWLRTQVHGRGALMPADALIREVTGNPIGTEAFRRHLEQRYLSAP